MDNKKQEILEKVEKLLNEIQAFDELVNIKKQLENA